MAEALKAGIAEVDITPPMGVEMCGYGPYEKRVCTEVLDGLYARALWLEADGRRLLILSADLCTIDLSTRDAAAAEIKSRCGIDPQNILIATTHTHSGPATQRMIGWGERDSGYVASLPGLLAGAAVLAKANAAPAKIGAARQRISDVGVNREQPALAPTDTAAQLLRLDTAEGKPLAAVFNFGAHAVVRYPFTTRISADWPGLAAACIQTELAVPMAMFLQGPCGNINAHLMTFTRRDRLIAQKVCDMRAGDVAKRFGDQAIPALKAIQTTGEAELSAAWRTVALPCAPPDRKALQETIDKNVPAAESMRLAQLRPLYQRMADETPQEVAFRKARFAVDSARQQLTLLDHPPYQVDAPVQVLKIGPAVIVGWAGEIFVELGLELRQRSPFPLTFVVSFANHTVGYIPTEAAYESQGRPNAFGVYPTSMTPAIYGRLPFRPDAGRILVEETLNILHAM